MDEVESVYTDIIMEHSTATYNKHELGNGAVKEHRHNPSCGDDITREIIWNGDLIEDLAFTGSGCAISQASTSIMIDLLKGKTKEEVVNTDIKAYNADSGDVFAISQVFTLDYEKILNDDVHKPFIR